MGFFVRNSIALSQWFSAGLAMAYEHKSTRQRLIALTVESHKLREERLQVFGELKKFGLQIEGEFPARLQETNNQRN